MAEDYKCVNTQNGTAYPDADLTDDRLHVMIGGGGNQGTNRLGIPYATSAIGSGPRVETGPDDKGIRKGASFVYNSDSDRRKVDRSDDYEKDYRRESQRR